VQLVSRTYGLAAGVAGLARLKGPQIPNCAARIYEAFTVSE